MDSQSVKNTDSAEQKGYDAGKKVSGIKRHIAVDTQGLPHAIHVTTANVTDRAGALAMFERSRAKLSQVQNGWWMGDTPGNPLPRRCRSLLGASVEVVKRNELLILRGCRNDGWGVFRLACRRWKNCEREPIPAWVAPSRC